MRTIIGAQWVTGKLAFLKIAWAWNTFHRRFYNGVGFCSIFWKFEVCTMHGEFALCGPWKSRFSTVAREFSNHWFYNTFGVCSCFGLL